jgi:hypothetical protein
MGGETAALRRLFCYSVNMQRLYGLYLNGLGDGSLSFAEKKAIEAAGKRGVMIEHIPIDWRSDESLDELLEVVDTRCRVSIEQHGRVILIGASAGGSLAVNVLATMKIPELSVITLCSRLNETKLAWWDARSLKRMAYMGKKGESKSFFDSVTRLTKTMPSLATGQKQRITIIKQWADEVVPSRTMDIQGAKEYRMRGIGHNCGIIQALRCIDHYCKGD